MKTITLEEHFVTQSFLQATGAYGHDAPPQLAEIQPKLLNLGAERIARMDEAAITHGRKFLQDAAASLGETEMEKLKGGNAKRLLRL